MEYVRGTDINTLSKFWLKRVADGRIEIHESLAICSQKQNRAS